MEIARIGDENEGWNMCWRGLIKTWGDRVPMASWWSPNIDENDNLLKIKFEIKNSICFLMFNRILICFFFLWNFQINQLSFKNLPNLIIKHKYF